MLPDVQFVFLEQEIKSYVMGARNSSIDRIIRKKNETGRPRGAISKKNKLLREMIEEFTDGNFHVFIEKMSEIDKPEVYAKLYLELLSFRMPKLKSIDFKGEVKGSSLEDKLKALRKDALEPDFVEEDEDEGVSDG